MTVQSQELVQFNQVMHALAEARSIDEVKQIRDKAEAVRKYAQSAALGLDAQNYAAEVKLRAERKAGSLLASLQLRGGDRKSNRLHDRLTLTELGISQNQSTRWQLETKLPDDKFEQYLAATRAAGKEITATAVIRLARQVVTSRRNNPSADDSRHFASHWANGKQQGRPGHRGESADAGDSELINEITNHLDLLEDVLEPICSGDQEVLELGPRRVLKHLLGEIKALLTQVHGEWH